MKTCFAKGLLFISCTFSHLLFAECLGKSGGDGLFSPASRFVDNLDGTVSNISAGLMWRKCSLGTSGPDCGVGNAKDLSWFDAKLSASGYSFAGYTDWRLPDLDELSNLQKELCKDVSASKRFFPNDQFDYFWSASTVKGDGGSAWEANFRTGLFEDEYKASLNKVRLVRSINP